MILLGMRVSPFVRKTIIHAAEKGMAMEVRPAGMGRGGTQGGEMFAKASPFGKMPALVDGDFGISDSSAIIAYVEALHPEPNLIPVAPRARARTVWYDEFADTIAVPVVARMFFNRRVAALVGRPADEETAAAAERDELPRIFDYLERIIPDSGFLVEDRLTLADIAVAGMMANVRYCSKALDDGRWPRLVKYVDALFARPAFAGALAEERAQMGWDERIK